MVKRRELAVTESVANERQAPGGYQPPRAILGDLECIVGEG
jgi:hypothetical protein